MEDTTHQVDRMTSAVEDSAEGLGRIADAIFRLAEVVSEIDVQVEPPDENPQHSNDNNDNGIRMTMRSIALYDDDVRMDHIIMGFARLVAEYVKLTPHHVLPNWSIIRKAGLEIMKNYHASDLEAIEFPAKEFPEMPWKGYDKETATDIKRRMHAAEQEGDLTDDRLQQIYEYERRHAPQPRVRILAECEALSQGTLR